MERRKFLALAGGGIVLAAGGIGSFAVTRTPKKALAPWDMAGNDRYLDPRMHALSYAVLAPNPHNRQPWLVELVGENQVVLRVDTNKVLPHTDPLNRQITIGLGCFLELMVMAAAADGYHVDLEIRESDHSNQQLSTEPIAVASFVQDSTARADPLFSFVHQRRSNKEVYDISRPVSRKTLSKIIGSTRYSTHSGGSIEKTDITALRALTEEALAIEIETPRTYKESVDLFRIGKSEINANPDGIDFSGALFETLHMTGQFDREIALDRDSSAFKQGQEAVLDNTRTAMGHIWLITDGNSRSSQIAAGRDWLRVNLEGTRQGLDMQPLSQALQEYAEMEILHKAVHKRLTPDGGTVQMLARIGYGPDVPVSPRWPLEAKLINS